MTAYQPPQQSNVHVRPEPGVIGHSFVAPTPPLVLLVGANAAERACLAEIFESEGFSTHEVDSGWAAGRTTQLVNVDLIVLDGRLGDGGAIAACQSLAISQAAPIIILAEEAEVTDRVIALEVGADDLIGRPFNRRELIARTRALLRRSRRSEKSSGKSLDGSAGRCTLNNATRVLTGPTGKRVMLPSSTCGILHFFMARAGEVVTVDTANDVFGPPGMTAGNFRTVIVRLRRKLAEAGFPDVSIASVRGSGYVWNESVEIHID